MLAALLLDDLKLRPTLRNGRYALADDGECILRRWQEDELRLTWCEWERPWVIERDVIALMKPPLNSAGTTTNASSEEVRQARRELRRRAAIRV